MDKAVRVEWDADRVATIWMDAPGKSVNVCSPSFLADLDEAIELLRSDRPVGAIFASAKARSFNAGADLFELRKMDGTEAAKYLGDGQALFQKVSNLPFPTVAAINGDCLGGGFELALACDFRVAAGQGPISIGLPETKLGLIPAWGGCTRLPRLIGLQESLALMLPGRTLPPPKALAAGIIDEVVDRDVLLEAAHRRAAVGRKRDSVDRLAQTPALEAEANLAAAAEQIRWTTFGNYPAPLRLIETIAAGRDGGIDAGLEAERRAIFDLLATDACRQLMRTFFLRQAARKLAAADFRAQPTPIHKAAVVGGGTMGAGIAHALIRAGIPTRLIEVDDSAAKLAADRVSKMLNDSGDGAAAANLTAVTDFSHLEDADIVIEAVVEKMEVKREIFAKIDGLAPHAAVLASNTSSLSILQMAEATGRPERVIGLHFFNPVPRMELVEVIRSVRSGDAALATGLALCARLGKTPVVINDAPGFIINWLLMPYLSEAIVLATEGVGIEQIDVELRRWGMPMGPFELMDEIGIDVTALIFDSLNRWPPSGSQVVKSAIANRWLGRKSGRGFYVHGNRRGELTINAELARALSASRTSLDADSIQQRLILPMVNAAYELLERKVTDSKDDIDLATVLGLGLAPFRGGIMQFAESVGAAQLVNQMKSLVSRHGQRFYPTALLKELATPD